VVCSVCQLEQAILTFCRKGHRVLVFGRQHMKSWDVYKQQRIRDSADWFFTQNVSVFLTCFLCNIYKLMNKAP